ncbi:hypothetical protein [Streptomyces regalis]|uniref:Uncharacterized protein n=1 Tax=Streptomyces regalis TaxID=68262 RepID=A0A124G8Q5_9ACTN|nr:hypothetical protein [Streptomyces regalis]KUL26632.1 hypothetical protein ADL12_32260 [Streptomyces regalis]
MSNPTRNVYGLMATPALDTQPTGHLPYLVAQARSHPEQPQLATTAAVPSVCYLWGALCVSQDGTDGDQVDEHGRHFDHVGHTISAPSGELPDDDPEIWAEFIHLSDSHPHIAFMGETLTPDQARARAAELHEFADQMAALANQVDAALTDTPAGGAR